jgi:hypothetical protein
MPPTVKSRSRTPSDEVSAVKVKEHMAIASRECLDFGAPGDTYDDRPTVMKRGSTHVDTAFTGLTSSRPGTVLRTLSTRRRSAQPDCWPVGSSGDFDT